MEREKAAGKLEADEEGIGMPLLGVPPGLLKVAIMDTLTQNQEP
jgi:hypothetical protein